MVYKLVETDEEPIEVLESYRRRFFAFGILARSAMRQAEAPTEIGDTLERLFSQVSFLIRVVIDANSIHSSQSIKKLEFAVEMINAIFWLTDVAVVNFKAGKGYELTGAIYKLQRDGLKDLIERLRSGPDY